MGIRQIFPKMLLRTLAAPMGRAHGSNGLLLCTEYIGVLGNMRTHVLSTEVRLRNGPMYCIVTSMHLSYILFSITLKDY